MHRMENPPPFWNGGLRSTESPVSAPYHRFSEIWDRYERFYWSSTDYRDDQAEFAISSRSQVYFGRI